MNHASKNRLSDVGIMEIQASKTPSQWKQDTNFHIESLPTTSLKAFYVINISALEFQMGKNPLYHQYICFCSHGS